MNIVAVAFDFHPMVARKFVSRMALKFGGDQPERLVCDYQHSFGHLSCARALFTVCRCAVSQIAKHKEVMEIERSSGRFNRISLGMPSFKEICSYFILQTFGARERLDFFIHHRESGAGC